MKPGFAMGAAILLLTAMAISAQSLGLGTGSRGDSDGDSTSDSRAGFPDDEATPRKTQINKRLGLTAHRNGPADPRVFEARGREIAGQFYEIGTPTGPKAERLEPSGPSAQTDPVQRELRPRGNGSRQWLWWVSAAGLAGASAGVTGFILMNKSHSATKPPDIPLNLDDSP